MTITRGVFFFISLVKSMKIRCATLLALTLILTGITYILHTTINSFVVHFSSKKSFSPISLNSKPSNNDNSTGTSTSSLPTKDQFKFRVNARTVRSQYSLQPVPCNYFASNITIVVMIISAPSHYTRRQAIRRTWGSLLDGVCGVRKMFVFGRVYNESLQKSLNQEAVVHKDILQCNRFDDVYRASALKTLYMFQWASAFCPDSIYTVRVDDDVWLNVPKFVNFVRLKFGSDEVLGLKIGANSTVVRDVDSQYYVPREEYALDLWPTYMNGMLFSYPTRLLAKVLKLSQRYPGWVFLDDIFVAGLLTIEANYTMIYHPDYAMHPNTIGDSNCQKRDRVAIHYVDVYEVYALWKDKCHRYKEVCE